MKEDHTFTPIKHKRYMATRNLVSASVTDEAMTAVKKGIADITAALPFLIALRAIDRRKMQTMGQKSVDFVNMALRAAETFPQYLLSSFNKDEFAKDVTLIDRLWKIRIEVAGVLEKLDDTIYAASVDAMQAANEVYDYLKTASERDQAAKAIVDDMRKRYDRPSKKSADGKKPEEKPQPNPQPKPNPKPGNDQG